MCRPRARAGLCASTRNNASCRPRKLGTAATCRHGTHPNLLETRSRETSTRFALCTTNKFARWSIFEKFPWNQIFPDEELLEPTLTESAHPRPLTRAPRLASPMAHMSPHPTNIRRPGTRAWEVGLCCPSGMDCGLCASATFCPCFVIGANAKMLKTGYITGPCCDDGGFGTNPCVYSGSLACLQGVAQTFISSALGTSATWFQLLPFYSCHWRKAVREKLDIEGHPGTDFASHYFCMPKGDLMEDQLKKLGASIINAMQYAAEQTRSEATWEPGARRLPSYRTKMDRARPPVTHSCPPRR